MTRTNAFTLLCVAIRAIVVYVGASAFVGVPKAFLAAKDGVLPQHGAMASLVVLGSVSLLLLLVWLFADKLARLALSTPRDHVFESDVDPTAWLGIAVSAIGAWFLFLAIKDGGYVLLRWLIVSEEIRDYAPDEFMSGEMTVDMLSIALEVALALIFLLRGMGIARLVHRLRYGPVVAAAERPGGQS